jgi:predicted HicB family RNase H-like nuclease
MKRTDLEKLKGLKIDGQMKRAGTPGRFGAEAAAAATSRREQRERERAQGLVPFAVKLDGELAKRVQALATERKAGLNELVAELLEKGLKA